MVADYSPSINIARDANKQFPYVLTANVKLIFNQIVNDYKIGVRSFTIIGSYGTGKSTFLLALIQSMMRKRTDAFSVNGQFGKVNEIVSVVGDYASLLNNFARRFNAKTNSVEAVITAIEKQYQTIANKQGCLIIAIDEFGKFLDYAAQNNPEQELDFVQQLAEFANDTTKNILLLTVLHQGFDSYGYRLNRLQREEWEKVKGRWQELTFNEPVEQLLELAAQYLQKSYLATKPQTTVYSLVNLIQTSRTYPRYNQLDEQFAQRLLPFEPLAAYVLTFALQEYAQNDRSLFTFLQANDRFGLNDYIKTSEPPPYYNLIWVHDYLLHNFYSLLSTVHNPHYTQWMAIKGAVERVEAVFTEGITTACHLVKIIGLLNIFSPKGARVDTSFLTEYARYCLNLTDINSIIYELETRKIIRYVSFKQTFILFDGTDLNIELAVLEAGQAIDSIRDVVGGLKKHFQFPYVLAKAVTYKTGTPRFFEFQLTDSPLKALPHGMIDGFINLIFSDNLTLDTLQEHTATVDEAILYGWYRNTKFIQNTLFELDKIQYVRKQNSHDQTAVRYLDELLDYHIDQLNRHVLQSLYQQSESLKWFFKGQQVNINSQFDFNRKLSQICESVYPATPIFKNELINRQRLSTSVSTARSRYLKALVEQWTDENLGFAEKTFPAEKTIYLSLLKETNIHRKIEDVWSLTAPEPETFTPLWQACEEFLENAKVIRKNIKDLFELLAQKPFKLKAGFSEFWVLTFLFIKRNAFALYHKGIYHPELSTETLDLIRKNPDHFALKSFDISGIKLEFFNRCRRFLQQEDSLTFDNNTFRETYLPFAIFYKRLPEYTRQTKNLSNNALKLRHAISDSTDPEQTFFEAFPNALGYGTIPLNKFDDTLLVEYTDRLQTSIKELRGCFGALVDRTEIHLLTELGLKGKQFPDYKGDIHQRLTNLRPHLLAPHQKSFHTRLVSPLDDRTAWISSLVQAVLSKNLAQLRDDEESLVYDRLSRAIHELDKLCDISLNDVNLEQEHVLKVEVSSYEHGTQDEILRFPKAKIDEIETVMAEIKTVITTRDKQVSQAALARLLEELMHE